jgi:8-oxo-dGTP pyrophosphatase MutT (NUDIX family)
VEIGVPETTPALKTQPEAIRPAATLLLLRDRGPQVEVLMMRRQRQLSFMGGMWVFPGGRLESADCSASAAARIATNAGRTGQSMRSIDGRELPPHLALGLRFAACRETYEEVGLLLARHRNGRPLSPSDVHDLQAERSRVADVPGAFIELLASADLVLELDRLVYWSHWITPSLEPKRFDTRFFAIAVPAGQDPSADEQESTELAWLSPRAASDAAERGEMNLVAPTLFTLEDLEESHSRHDTVTAMLAAEQDRPTPAVMPRLAVEAGATRVVMPWDPAYAAIEGEGCAAPEGFPPHLTRRRSSMSLRRNLSVR